MRLVLQRVSSASVTIGDRITGQIGPGLMILVGFGKNDTLVRLPQAIKKIRELRIFNDDLGKMNRSLVDIAGSVLLVSQFTLYANCSRGRRPDFVDAAPPDHAKELYHAMLQSLIASGIPTQAGVFGADMQIELVNDGPVTIILDL